LNLAEEEGTLFRSGGTVTPNLLLGPNDVPVIPGAPDPILTGGSSPNSTMTQAGAEVATIDYDVTGFGTWAGVTFNYDDFGTVPYESADLSGLTQLVFGLTSDANTVRFEIEDADGDRDVFTLRNVTTSERVYEIDVTLISSLVDLSRIRLINFVVNRNIITNGNRTGTLSVHAKGLAPSFVAQSSLIDSSSFSDLIGFPERQITGGSSLQTQVIPIDSQQVDLQYGLPATDSFSGLLLAYDSFATATVETFDLSQDPNIAVGLQGDAQNIRFEIEDVFGRRVNLSLEGITAAQETFYQIDLSLLAADLDLTQIRFINFVVDRNTIGGGPIQGVVHIRYGTFVPDTTPPDVIMTSPAATNNPDYTLTYTVDGDPRSESLTLTQGQNTLHREFSDLSGNTTAIDFIVTLDSVPPEIVFTSSNLTNQTLYTLAYTVDGTPTSQSVNLVEGVNTLNVSEADLAGNVATAAFTVTLDTVPPEILFTSSSLVNDANYLLTYSTDGIAGEAIFTLVEGENVLTVTESDAAGNETTESMTVTLDTVPPTLELTSPSLVNDPNYTLGYLVDGVLTQATITLVEGANVITREEVDTAGNITTITWVITLDTVAPAIAFHSSPLTNNPTYLLDYSVDGVRKTQEITLLEGENVLSIVEADLAGNETRIDFTVTLDTVPPEIIFTSVSVTNQALYMLTYTVDGTLLSEGQELLEGQNSFTRTFTDSAGNESIETFTVTLDTVPPEITLTSATLTNEVNYLLTYTVDGVESEQPVTLIEGENILSVSETDAAGNITTRNFAVTLDTIPPVVVFTSSNLTNDANYTLVYTSDGVQQQVSYTLTEGENVLTVTETDAAGNTTNTTLSVTLDTIPPELILQSATLTNDPNYAFIYTVDGVPKTSQVTLTEGVNSFTVTETDAAGNQSTTTFSMTLDTIPPAASVSVRVIKFSPSTKVSVSSFNTPSTV